ncbi:MAG: hypothetical protein H6807_12055 [Planctomycetes bacterium]|nr:hypothetical protein [Planctomycetota bacterium]
MSDQNDRQAGIIRVDVEAEGVDLDLDREELRYEFEVRPDQLEMEDGIVLTLNREACLEFARIFGQLALGRAPEGYALRLGWDETDAVGFRVVLDESGRTDSWGDEA